MNKTSRFNYLSHNIIVGPDDNVGLLCARYAGGVD
jgi:hypothetical protein